MIFNHNARIQSFSIIITHVYTDPESTNPKLSTCFCREKSWGFSIKNKCYIGFFDSKMKIHLETKIKF